MNKTSKLYINLKDLDEKILPIPESNWSKEQIVQVGDLLFSGYLVEVSICHRGDKHTLSLEFEQLKIQ